MDGLHLIVISREIILNDFWSSTSTNEDWEDDYFDDDDYDEEEEDWLDDDDDYYSEKKDKSVRCPNSNKLQFSTRNNTFEGRQ